MNEKTETHRIAAIDEFRLTQFVNILTLNVQIFFSEIVILRFSGDKTIACPFTANKQTGKKMFCFENVNIKIYKIKKLSTFLSFTYK